MRLHAYVLAGDPSWAAESVTSYYPLVEKIVVSYDVDGRSWSGHPLLVEESLRVLRSIDVDGKIVLLPGRHSDAGRPVLHVETEQRQAALEAAAPGADWVLQLDTDEVLLSQQTFVRHLEVADRRGASALEYPMRDFYQHLGGDRYLEHCGRFWGDQGNYPGPVAVRSGVRLHHCRQASAALYRVDMRPWNTDPAHPRQTVVHATVGRDEAIAHLSWVRTREHMLRKSRTSGYAASRDWQNDLRRWEWRRRHPYLTAASVPFRRNPFDRFRISELTLSKPAADVPVS